MTSTPTQTLATDLLNRLDALIRDAEQKTKPLELEPYRGQLFEMFVIAEASGLMREGSNPDLSADGITAELSARWGLKAAAASMQPSQPKFSNEQLSKMRLMWSFLRMWMEWQYAWSRWSEFHEQHSASPTATPS